MAFIRCSDIKNFRVQRPFIALEKTSKWLAELIEKAYKSCDKHQIIESLAGATYEQLVENPSMSSLERE